MVRRAPGVAAVVIVTIAIGVGAATSMFSILRNLVLAPPPHVADPDTVFRLHHGFPQDDGSESVFVGTSYPFYELLASRAASLDAVAAYRGDELAVGTGSDARMAQAAMVSAGFWKTLGPRPALGRFIQDQEAHPATGARVVVLGHAFWQRHYGASAGVVGSTLRVKGQPYEIIGVAPRGFRGIELSDVDLWLPMFAVADGSANASRWHIPATSYNLTLVGRLKTDVTNAQASAELSTLYSTFLLEAYGPSYTDPAKEAAFRERNRRARTRLGPVGGGVGGDLRHIPEARVTAWLVGIAFVLLGIACSNIAGLLLLRAVARRREIAMRLALGASRRRLAFQLLTESSLLALLGGVAACLTVAWSGAWLQRTILPAMAWEPTRLVDPIVISVAALCVFAAAFSAGMAPLWYARADGTSALRDGILRGPSKRPRMLTGLLTIQGALTVVLLVGAGLFLRSLHNAQTEDLGLDRHNVLAAQIDFSGTGRPAADIAAFFERALERASTVPGVSQASLTLSVPLRSARGGGSFRLPGRNELPAYPTGGPYVNSVTPGFFATTGMRITQGRDFLPRERNQMNAILVNETMANLYWPGRSPIGECVYRRRQQACTTVVGVVADARGFRIVEKDRYAVLLRADGHHRDRFTRPAGADGSRHERWRSYAAPDAPRCGSQPAVHRHRHAGQSIGSRTPAMAAGRVRLLRVRAARRHPGHDRSVVVGGLRRLAANPRIRDSHDARSPSCVAHQLDAQGWFARRADRDRRRACRRRGGGPLPDRSSLRGIRARSDGVRRRRGRHPLGGRSREPDARMAGFAHRPGGGASDGLEVVSNPIGPAKAGRHQRF